MSNHCAVWPRNRSVTVGGLAALALLAVGCGDDSHRLGGANEGVSGQSRLGLCAEGAAFESLDQMEDGDGTIDMTEQRSGVWFAFNDKTGTQVPHFDEEIFLMSELDPPRAGTSHFAARSHGSGFSGWGAGIGFELYSQKAYDVSKYAGITFWARRAPNTSASLRFAIPDSATAKRGGQCEEIPDQRCNDYFGIDLDLGTAFRRYNFTWRELKQGPWGWPRPEAVNTKEVYGIRFQHDAFEDFDFWIDDIALICKAD